VLQGPSCKPRHVSPDCKALVIGSWYLLAIKENMKEKLGRKKTKKAKIKWRKRKIKRAF
jgi:hypothetical protein